MALKFEATFISMKTTEPAKKRSQSLPALPGRSGASSTTDKDSVGQVQRYLDQLMDRAENLRPEDQDGQDEEQMAPERNAEEVQEEENKATSQGSLGHPELCRRPCIYLQKGDCAEGANCGYCHDAHHERSKKLDKRQREFLRSLDDSIILALLLPHLRTRAHEATLPETEAGEVVSLLERKLATMAPATAPAIPMWQLSRLNKVLKKLTFIRLMRLATCHELPDVDEALVRLQEAYSINLA
mmetsp:Transcript_14524/g.34528  ORF Transcript_14524/g.34528 Transcript_14524/m.34528 type:complete len:242 (+) Transcript_14524:78-803(+)